MANETLELFYSYAPEDEPLLKELEKHLTLLKREGLISDWHHKRISAGGHFAKEVGHHLQSARIILLLISPDFLSSDYYYGNELQGAMKRYQEGTAYVVPILLRPCDWPTTLLGDLQAFPRNRKAVTEWGNLDAAFAEIVSAIRELISEMHGQPRNLAYPEQYNSPTISTAHHRKSGDSGTMTEASKTPTTLVTALSPTTLKKAMDNYYRELHNYKGKANYESALRSAFQNLLASLARAVNWTLLPEYTLANNIRPDGTLRDDYFARGYWEAKGPEVDLEKEIREKVKKGYPLTNTIFENTKRAILYQNKKRAYEYNLTNRTDLSDLLHQFFEYVEPDIATFEAAVQEFKERIPELAQRLYEIIKMAHAQNQRFISAFEAFAELCRKSLDKEISQATLDEMLIQHLLTERLFRTVFNNPDFTRYNIIANEIENVIQALVGFNRTLFLKSLDRFYIVIEAAAKGQEDWTEKQHFLDTVYERFFQGFAVKKADTYGIIYTPQEIVEFMCSSVEEVLKKYFNISIADKDVQILDPCTGTGNFIVNLLRRIPSRNLTYKYKHDLFCNEIMLLPYYIASLNIEQAYFERMNNYEPFEGICFADTLNFESLQMELFSEKNTGRIQVEKAAQIMVVIGNPPYNVGQKSENDNNKNRKYAEVDKRIKETYVKDSHATLKTQLYDAYVRFFRWATDRLQGHDGIVCFVSNNSFVDQIAFDGMRKHLLRDFTQIYHLDLHGNVRKNPKLSGTTHNVFGIQLGVGITVAIRNSQNPVRIVQYYRVPEDWRKTTKLSFLREKKNITEIAWIDLQPDKRHTWITNGLKSEFSTWLPLGMKETKTSSVIDIPAIFSRYSGGVKTNRDTWAYDFRRKSLEAKMKRLIDTYNSDVDRWRRREDDHPPIDHFVTYDDTKIKWSGDLKIQLTKGKNTSYTEKCIRRSLYRPFVKQYLYFDALLNNSIYLQHLFFPKPDSELENIVICVPGLGDRKGFGCLATNFIANLDLAFEKAQCFPYYTYAEDGTNRRENITGWALKQFQDKYGADVTKWDIFHYIYAMLHHPQYRERYAENLKRDLPHIPLLLRYDAFSTCVRMGKQLMDLHLNYEQAKEYKLQWLEQEGVPFSWHVEKMKLTPDKTAVIVNESLTLAGIPPECFEYRLGNRSALEWVINQYQVSKDQRSSIESDPNGLDNDEEYIVHLVGRVVTVSVETVRLVNALARTVMAEDWLGESTVVEETTLG